MQISDLVYIDATGYHYADYPTFLAYYTETYQTIYGADVYIEPDSEDGQWIAIQAQAAYDSAANGAAVYLSFSPSTAQGVGLARNVRINGIEKRVATNSTVDVDIVGQTGTTITNGIVQDTLNQKWNLPASVVIPLSGTITVTAIADVAGAVTAAATTVNQIFTPTQGWQTVNNPDAATVGVPIETDPELRARQAVSTENPSQTVFDGTLGAVANVMGVTEVQGYENDTNATDANGLPAHSISVVVAGGDATEIAQTILNHKTPGCYTYGTTSEVVYDQYGMPNTIRFYRPTQIRMLVEISITVFAGYSSAYNALIAQAVADSINALGIGNDVLITKLYVPANLPGTVPGTTYDITDLQIKKFGGSFAPSNVVIAFNEIANLVVADVAITVVP